MSKRKNYIPAKIHTPTTTGEVVKMLRELKGWTQADLAQRSGISGTNISLIEHNKLDIGKKRAIALAISFDIHPAIIMFPEYDIAGISKAA